MNSEEHPRNLHFSANRKVGQSKTHGYSPSSNYNYNGNQSQHGNHTTHGNSSYNNGNKPHHRKQGGGGTFKRDNHGSSDKIIKQNDLIIRLLKEIRDRLPEPVGVVKEVEEMDVLDDTEDEQMDQELEQTASDNNADASGQDDFATEALDDDTMPGNEAVTVPLKEISEDDELDSKVNGNI